jgi:putative ABC transport system ATP-binding protein
MSDPVVEAINIVKFLGEGARKVQALKGVNLKLAGGELVLLMGPSGSGKTTLLSVLGCILSPNEGSVRVCGHATSGLRPEALAKLRLAHIGFVFQTYHLFPTLTAIDNVRLVLEVGGERPHHAAAKVMDVLAMVGLPQSQGAPARA